MFFYRTKKARGLLQKPNAKSVKFIWKEVVQFSGQHPLWLCFMYEPWRHQMSQVCKIGLMNLTMNIITKVLLKSNFVKCFALMKR